MSIFLDGEIVAGQTGALAFFNNVKRRLRGEPRATDYANLQAAINDAKMRNGGRGDAVYIPSGTYTISQPCVIPRTSATPTNIVHLEGAGIGQTTIRGAPNFPAGRALIEWEATPNRALEQRISGITFDLPNVAGVKAIHYAVTDNSSWAAMNQENLQIVLEDIKILAHNDYHPVLIKLEGTVNYSSIRRVFGDPALGNGTYDTLLLQTDRDFNGVFPGYADGPGLFMCDVSHVYGMINRGGQCATFEGRIHRSEIHTCFSNGGKSRPSFAFYNSYSSDVRNVGTEGQGETPQFLFNNCHQMTATAIGIGTPNAIGGNGVGNGLELVNCHDCTFDSRFAAAGQPAFSSLGVKVVTVDNDSRDNTFTRWGIRSAGISADELDIKGGATNTVAYKDYHTGMSGTVVGT